MWTNRQLPAPSSAPNRTSPSSSLSPSFLYFHLLSDSIPLTTPPIFTFSLIFSQYPHPHFFFFFVLSSSNFNSSPPLPFNSCYFFAIKAVQLPRRDFIPQLHL
uniref:Uncharacterized protein n=1 Tax=Cucumis sativus TaxID=3659 RepID=A0A0A0M194_CUCSA